MTKRSSVQTIFQAPFICIKSLEQKEIMECFKLPGIVASAVIPLMGGSTLRTVGL
jgi:hypothetical protein